MAFGEFFLDNPDLFPTRPEGAPWGGCEAVVDFAGGPYRFAGLSPQQERAVRDRFGGLFAEPRREPRVLTRIFRAPAIDFRPIDAAGWEYTLDLAHDASAVKVAGLGFMARLDWRPELAAAVWTPASRPAEFLAVFENVFRVVVAYTLLAEGGALLHSAGVVTPAGACLFYGRSGAGKTTLARRALAAGREVLSDDLNAVVPGGGEACVERVPFAGDLGRGPSPGGAHRLAALLRLEKGAGPRIRRSSAGEALASLLACSPFTNNDPLRSERLAESLAAHAAHAATGVVTVPRDVSFQELEELLAGELGLGA